MIGAAEYPAPKISPSMDTCDPVPYGARSLTRVHGDLEVTQKVGVARLSIRLRHLAPLPSDTAR